VREAAVAFSAGLLSFATPCVLPLVPAYLSAIGARSTDPRRALLASLPFVLGFSLVFVALGASAGLAGGALTDHRLQLVKLSGIVIVAMGLVMVGLIRLPALDRSFAPGLGPARASGSSVLLGGAFGLVGCDAAQLFAQLEPAPEALAGPVGVLDAAADRVGALLELERDARGIRCRHTVIVLPG